MNLFRFSEIQTLIQSFGSHLNVDLQQRGVEFTQLFGSHNHLRPALLEKMPPMQISRIATQNGGTYDENSPDLIENGLEEAESNMNTVPALGDQSVRRHSFKKRLY